MFLGSQIINKKESCIKQDNTPDIDPTGCLIFKTAACN